MTFILFLMLLCHVLIFVALVDILNVLKRWKP